MLINLPLRKGEKIEKKEGKIWYFCSEEEIWNFAWKYIKIFSVLKITFSSWYDINDAQIKQKVDEKIWYARGKKRGKKKRKRVHEILYAQIISTTQLLLSRHLPTNARKIEFIISTTSRIFEKRRYETSIKGSKILWILKF